MKPFVRAPKPVHPRPIARRSDERSERMNAADTHRESNLIHFNRVRATRGRIRNPRGVGRPAGTRVIAVTSGKGGVGKTNIVANLAYAFGDRGKRTLILDADLGLGNIDVLMGKAPRYNISHVIRGEKDVDEVLIEGPGNSRVLPASSGIQELTTLDALQRVRLISALDRLMAEVDILLIDTGAGISTNVMYFNVSAQEVLVVVTPEPTAITDAYALMKVMSMQYDEHRFQLVVNMAVNGAEADEVYRQLQLVARRFLDIRIDYLGFVPRDPDLGRSVRRQKLVCELFPEAESSRHVDALAGRLLSRAAPTLPAGYSSHFWKYLIQEKFSRQEGVQADFE